MDSHSNCGPFMDGPWRTTITVASTDTSTDRVRQGVHSWMVHRWSVTVASATLSEGGRQCVHPWMVHELSMDDPWMVRLSE